MPRTAIITAAGAALLLSACSDSNADADANGTVSPKEVVEKAQTEMPRPQPGLYKTTVTMTGIEIPGVPEGHGAGQVVTTEDCLTQAEVDKGFEELVKQGQDGECTYERFNLAGGKLDAVMVCDAQGRVARMEMTGTITATSADMQASTALDFEGMGSGKMTFTAKHERIGECPAK
ncbi:MAG: DUF3617 domain-containing protein [Porphyrobacter sp.]|nr:DUF3617 domain-containing protein [Porphyrobacter sp.]